METNPQPEKNYAPKVLSIVGLVAGILTLIFSLIPCIGYYALIPAIIGTVCSGLAFYLQKQEGKSTQLSLIAIVLGLLATGSAYYQYVQFKSVFDTKARVERVVEGFEEKVEKEAADAVIDYTKEKIDNYLEKDSLQDAKKEQKKK